MANKNYLKIINLGKWLELYLNPSLKSHGYKDLAVQAINLLDIDYRLTDDDIILKNIEEFQKLSPEDQKEFLNLGKTPPGPTDWESMFKSLDKFGWNKTHAMVRFKKSKFRPLFVFHGGWSLENFFSIYRLREILFNLFQIIIKQEEPWAHALDSIISYRGDKGIVVTIHWLKALYGDFVERLVFSEGRAVVQKTFRIDGSGLIQMSVCYEINGVIHTPSCLPWRSVIPRIFFDFLLAGGQEYFGFCGLCGNFMAVERKGRKKFCSDICRTAYRHKETPHYKLSK